ncbi:hypothetical protein D3C87_445590 [compost metagenome]
MKLKFIFAAALLSSPLAQAKTVSDSLVQNLSCSKLSADSIYSSIREDAFSARRHLPFHNWNTGMIGNCWSLSRAQRLFIMLGREDNTSTEVTPVLNILRNAIPWPEMDEGTSQMRLSHRPLKGYSVFKLDSIDNLNRSEFMKSLTKGIPEAGSPNGNRGFVTEIEAFQAYRFNRAGNLSMGLGSYARSEKDNVATAALLKKNADKKRLTLINLRASQLFQHVVVVKDYKEQANGNLMFRVYDSNNPYSDGYFQYDKEAQQFYAPGIMRESAALGAFIVDEDERAKIDAALVTYYKSQCK